MALDFAALQARKRPNSASVDICLDPSTVDAYHAALQKRSEASAGLRSDDDEARAKVESADKAVAKARKALEAAAVTFSFRALGAEEFEALLHAHPPTKEDIATARRKGQSPPRFGDTFGPAFVAACLTEPVLSPEEVAVIWKDPAWSFEERDALFAAAWVANQVRQMPDLGKESGPTGG